MPDKRAKLLAGWCRRTFCEAAAKILKIAKREIKEAIKFVVCFQNKFDERLDRGELALSTCEHLRVELHGEVLKMLDAVASGVREKVGVQNEREVLMIGLVFEEEMVQRVGNELCANAVAK